MSIYYGFTCVIIALAVGFGIVLATLVKVQHEERHDLYGRIMAGSLGEYKAANAEPRQNKKKPPHERAVEQWMKQEE